MRQAFCKICAITLFAVIAVGVAVPVSADEHSALQQTRQSVDMVLDHATGAVRFYVDGQEVARIDRDGLRVRDDIEYGGTITDTGRDYYDAAAIPLSAPDHAD